MSLQPTNYSISQAVYNVRTGLKHLSDDSYFTNRYIYSKLKAARNYILKQQGDKLSLLDGNAVDTINCILLEEVEISQCCNIPLYQKINRSKYRIPSLLDSKLQRRYIRMYNIDRSKIYTYNSPEGILQQSKMKYSYPGFNFFFEDQFLYFDGPMEAVRLSGIFENPEDVTTYNICQESECNTNKDCNFVPMLKRRFTIPGFLQQQMEDITIDKILKESQIGRIDEENNSKDDSMN